MESMMSLENQNSSLKLTSPNNNRIAADHARNILNKLLNFYEKEEFCETVLISDVDNTHVRAHQIILSASGEYFRTYFSNTLKGNNLDKVRVREVDGVTLKSVINFMYTGSIELCSETVEIVTRTAHFLQMDSLIKVCTDFMAENIDVSNCFGVAHFAEQYNLNALAKKSLAYASENFEKVSGKKEFLELSEEQLCDFISGDNIQVDSEENVFHSLVAWINHDKENRGNSVFNLLNHIRFTSLTHQFIIGTVALVCNTIECHNLVVKWLQWHSFPDRRSELGVENVQPRNTYKKLVLVNYTRHRIVSIQYFNPQSKKWLTVGFEHLQRQNNDFSIGTIGDRKLITAAGNSVACFDFKTKQWSDLPPLRVARRFCKLVEVNGILYALGGKDVNYGQYLNSVEKYDANLREWQTMPCLPQYFQCEWSCAVNGALYALSTDLKMQCYIPTLGLWSEKRVPPEKTIIASVNGHLYALAGNFSHVYRYSPFDDAWNISGSLDIGQCISCATLNNELVTYSIKNGKGIITQYDPETNETKSLGSVSLQQNSNMLLSLHISV